MCYESEVKVHSMSNDKSTSPPIKKSRSETINLEIMENTQEDARIGLDPGQSNNLNDSLDMFSDSDVAIQIEADPIESDAQIEDDAYDDMNYMTDIEMNEVIQANKKSWKGVSLAEISKGCDCAQLPRIAVEDNHTVLFQLPVVDGEIPVPSPASPEDRIDAWDNNHVRLPCSPQNLYTANDVIISRWELIKETLTKPIKNSHELAAAILTYNNKYVDRWDFSTLHYFFNKEMEEEETDCFFTAVLPNVITLALQLPRLVTSPIPLLRQHRGQSVSLSQLQISSLLANAFLCTFPRRNLDNRKSEYASYPDINFTRLYAAGQRHLCKIEKLKCLLYYLRKVCIKVREGTVTYTRRYVEKSSLPRWDRVDTPLKPIHITSNGTIEDQGGGMLQVDFANKIIGGGVLGNGCVQEEIRFVICPELILARLFTEELDATEALLITGCERYSNYSGYASTFQWLGEYEDETPLDSSGRRACSIVAIDAEPMHNPGTQFMARKMLRELNKAYVGFYNPDLPKDDRLAPVATGNWGCGAFNGKATLKALIQVMAASEAGRSVVYFTFDDEQLRDDVHEMHAFLVEQRVSVGKLWRLLSQYYDQCFTKGKATKQLYDYLYDAVLNKRAAPKQTTLDSMTSTRQKKDCSSRRPNNHFGESSRSSVHPDRGLDSAEVQKALEESSRTEQSNAFEFNAEDLERALASVDNSLEAKLARIESTSSKIPKPGTLFEALDALDSCKSPVKPSVPITQHSPAKFLEAFERREIANSTTTTVDKIASKAKSKLTAVHIKENIVISESSSESSGETTPEGLSPEECDISKDVAVGGRSNCDHVSAIRTGEETKFENCDERLGDCTRDEFGGDSREVIASGSSLGTNNEVSVQTDSARRKESKVAGKSCGGARVESLGLLLKTNESSSSLSGSSVNRNSAPQKRISDYFSSSPRTQ